jgi:hypothetical protein
MKTEMESIEGRVFCRSIAPEFLTQSTYLPPSMEVQHVEFENSIAADSATVPVNNTNVNENQYGDGGTISGGDITF